MRKDGSPLTPDAACNCHEDFNLKSMRGFDRAGASLSKASSETLSTFLISYS
jgi:hypothetical protein